MPKREMERQADGSSGLCKTTRCAIADAWDDLKIMLFDLKSLERMGMEPTIIPNHPRGETRPVAKSKSVVILSVSERIFEDSNTADVRVVPVL